MDDASAIGIGKLWATSEHGSQRGRSGKRGVETTERLSVAPEAWPWEPQRIFRAGLSHGTTANLMPK
jgi:hypothetical protein